MVLAANNFGEENKADSTTKRSDKQSRNFRFSILGGPGYTPDFGFLIGGSTLMTFKLNPNDSIQKRTVLPLAFGLTFNNGVGFNLQLKPQIFFKEDKMRLFGNFLYKNTNDNYYGVGYSTNHSRQRGTETTQFFASQIKINPIFLVRIPRTDLFVGPVYDLAIDNMKEPSMGVRRDPSFIAQGGDSTGLHQISSGLGVAISYDTRDVPANAYKGVYFYFDALYYSKALGGDTNFGQVILDYRQYYSLEKIFGPRRILSWTVSARNAFGDVPITRMPLLGSPFDLRGYYMGQYRDHSTALAVAEYRHMLNFEGSGWWARMGRKFGFAVWGGAGVVGPKFGKYDAVLPNYGVGLRIEVQPRMNFRMDIGKSPIDGNTLLYFNMTEAF